LIQGAAPRAASQPHRCGSADDAGQKAENRREPGWHAAPLRLAALLDLAGLGAARSLLRGRELEAREQTGQDDHDA
jgi:hypothetical protein